MKIRFLNWINLFVFALDIFAALFGFMTGQIIMPILCIAAGLFNLYAFLYSVSLWWEKSEKVRNKFIFTCPKCTHKFVPNFWRWIFVPHIFSKRFFKCDMCGHYSWMRRK